MTVDQVPWAGLTAAGCVLLAAAIWGMWLMLGRAWGRGYGVGWNDGWEEACAQRDRRPATMLQPVTFDGELEQPRGSTARAWAARVSARVTVRPPARWSRCHRRCSQR